jgi:hypothetical protein
MSDFSKTSKLNNGLELFFGSDSKDFESSYLKKASLNVNDSARHSGAGGSEADFQMISPVKDQNISKLQTSVDNLRKAFQKEVANGERNEELIRQRVQNTRRKLCALKIQRWYRKVRASRLNRRQTEIEQYVEIFKLRIIK